MKHIISLSGGIGSYITLKRVLEKNKKEDIEIIFCDTLYEDGDLYRFLYDIENKLDIKITRLCKGKTPTQLQIENNFVFNSRVANCSKELKSKVFKEYIKKYDPEEIIIYMGIDWTEEHRTKAIIENYKPYKVDFPLCKETKTKVEYLEELQNDQIEIPRLYKIGLTHNNCGGRCVKAGIGHYLKLLENDRNRYLEAENEEKYLQEKIGKEYTHLKRKGKPYSLKQLREDKEQQLSIFDFLEETEYGGCSCFSD